MSELHPSVLGIDNLMKITILQFFGLIFYAVIMGASQIIMAKASKQLGNNLKELNVFEVMLNSYWLYIAIIFYVFATGVWLFILYRVDIRIAYPIASTAVIFAALIQTYIDGTLPQWNYWVGLVIVIIGLWFINLK